MVTDLDKPYEGRFEAGVHRYAVRVYFEDTDAAGVVYYANYLRFMERARSDMLRAAGIAQRQAMENGAGAYAVAEVHIRYRVSARLDDDLLVLSQVREVRAAACVIQQRVMRGTEVLCEATVTVALVGPDGRAKRQPPEWVQKFEDYKRQSLGE